ncbi:ATP-binding protein [Kitasatospora purpeofusca]|uniref:ATP-binding protein n=1 Tax=Kitasatospora purpeofusca TaxID=67352 RepID=UPI0037F965AE
MAVREDPPGSARTRAVWTGTRRAVQGVAEHGEEGVGVAGAAEAQGPAAAQEHAGAGEGLHRRDTEREERKATAVATNSPFTEWDKAFGDARLCAAIADRITFRCTLIQTGTESYRYQATQESLFSSTN